MTNMEKMIFRSRIKGYIQLIIICASVIAGISNWLLGNWTSWEVVSSILLMGILIK